ncbi:hypothetical protein DAPPUDRAFT_272488 [Daphnia pulex]|uniref:Uncharacterized protein n=1 Tax=Daphnia pulex TaxID=6669 RepID=E9I318_DAPPU|nr:hypothetical protein DAPPUDRAFT_272488 [Daphnia pulex]|eukprot:EFX61612.1 hypothetical protein DAPPUDRAFT_272488 [Daphnia pulex]
MAPPTAKTLRSTVKGLITKKINQLKTYEPVTMTIKTSNELDDLKQDLKKKFENFQQLSVKVQEELNASNAPQEDYQTETEYIGALGGKELSYGGNETTTNAEPDNFPFCVFVPFPKAPRRYQKLTDANYQIAIDELQKTYGKKEVLISAHFEKLDSLQPVRDAKDVAALRNLQLTIQSHISALETLGKGKSTYGSLLGTKLIKLVPYKQQEKWSEVETNDSTDIDCVLKFIREQTEAAERFGRLKVAEKPKQAQSNPQQKQTPPPATASQLATGARMNSANPVQEKQADLASFATKGTGHRNAQRI